MCSDIFTNLKMWVPGLASLNFYVLIRIYESHLETLRNHVIWLLRIAVLDLNMLRLLKFNGNKM